MLYAVRGARTACPLRGVKKVIKSKEKIQIVIAGLIIGAIASALVLLGNPANMGFCIACFIRDTAGALGLHKAPPFSISVRRSSGSSWEASSFPLQKRSSPRAAAALR